MPQTSSHDNVHGTNDDTSPIFVEQFQMLDISRSDSDPSQFLYASMNLKHIDRAEFDQVANWFGTARDELDSEVEKKWNSLEHSYRLNLEAGSSPSCVEFTVKNENMHVYPMYMPLSDRDTRPAWFIATTKKGLITVSYDAKDKRYIRLWKQDTKSFPDRHTIQLAVERLLQCAANHYVQLLAWQFRELDDKQVKPPAIFWA